MTEAWQIVNDFWFGKSDSEIYGTSRKEWFIKNPAFDDQVRETLDVFYQQAKSGTLDDWRKFPLGCVALMVLLDQVPRNLFRGSPQAFATDEKALEIAKQAIAANFDKELLVVQRLFLYLPFEHSENIEEQRRSLELFAQLKDNPISESYIDYAQKHFDVIEQFGRFPHRNKILERESTAAELEFLSQPGSSF
ncbi:DUF924 family protein [[Limnothrix rosea] IAM M-220]|uniref:DUF924 family protein n=1 Tax=[Limnothrix rosea] IAM M-220 TaxID=454133 RepID=UPI000964C945|nr:DUF924 family protein [[Limnothrix rosea] IAM M-220]OKH19239.1 hypothetical protein NIES208_03020 [[Limnothrix rosea] IAM M-220]